MTARQLLAYVLLCLLTCSACTKPSSDTRSANAKEPTPTAAAPTLAPVSTEVPATPTEPAPTINPTRAFQYVKDYVAIGSRKPGSPGHVKAEQFIKSHLAGDNDSRQGPLLFSLPHPGGGDRRFFLPLSARAH